MPAPTYTGLVQLDRLRWAVELLTRDAAVAATLTAVHVGRDGPHGAADQALQLLRRWHGPAPAAAPQATPGRQRVADELARLPRRARLALVAIDGCGIPVADAAAGLGWSRWRTRRALALARRRLAAAIAGGTWDAATLETALGGVLRALRPGRHDAPAPAVAA